MTPAAPQLRRNRREGALWLGVPCLAGTGRQQVAWQWCGLQLNQRSKTGAPSTEAPLPALAANRQYALGDRKACPKAAELMTFGRRIPYPDCVFVQIKWPGKGEICLDRSATGRRGRGGGRGVEVEEEGGHCRQTPSGQCDTYSSFLRQIPFTE